jgi:hypothetical protein
MTSVIKVKFENLRMRVKKYLRILKSLFLEFVAILTRLSALKQEGRGFRWLRVGTLLKWSPL